MGNSFLAPHDACWFPRAIWLNALVGLLIAFMGISPSSARKRMYAFPKQLGSSARRMVLFVVLFFHIFITLFHSPCIAFSLSRFHTSVITWRSAYEPPRHDDPHSSIASIFQPLEQPPLHQTGTHHQLKCSYQLEAIKQIKA